MPFFLDHFYLFIARFVGAGAYVRAHMFSPVLPALSPPLCQADQREPTRPRRLGCGWRVDEGARWGRNGLWCGDGVGVARETVEFGDPGSIPSCAPSVSLSPICSSPVFN